MGALGVFTLRQIENLKQALKVSPVMVQIQNTLGWGWESLIAPIITCDGVKCNGSVIEGKTGPTPISPLLTHQILPSATCFCFTPTNVLVKSPREPPN